MKKSGYKIASFAMASVLVASLLTLSGCAGKLTEESLEGAVMQEIGTSSEVLYKYGFFGLTYGPYVIEVTPVGLTTVNDNGREVEAVEMLFHVKESEDGKPADFAASSCVVELLNSELDVLRAGDWYSDKDGTRIGATPDEKLPIGEELTLYLAVPNGSENSDFKYFSVSGREGISARVGDLYIYEMN